MGSQTQFGTGTMRKKSFLMAAGIAALSALVLIGCGGKNHSTGGGGSNKDTADTTYVITFDANGGTVTYDVDMTGVDGRLDSLPTTVKASHDFDGWFTAITGGTEVTTGATGTVFTSDTTIYARWTAQAGTVYTITIDPNDGTSAPMSGVTGTDGKLASWPRLTRPGYTQTGWFTAATGGTEVSGNTIFTENTLIYAQWRQNAVTYTITLDANGGTVNPASTVTNLTSGTVAVFPTPSRSGYTFNGWFTEATGGTAVTTGATGTVFTENTTIYAHWTQNAVTYTITFSVGDGSVTPTSGTTGVDGTLDSLPTPTRDGYIFNGWYTLPILGTQVTLSRVYTANTTIFARWVFGFVDSRDSTLYRKVTIGNQTWMKENLNYEASGSECYGNSADSCAKYGRLYNWATAMNGASSSSANPSGVQGACPVGWHLPSDAEWTTLTNFVGAAAGEKLKSTTGWNSNGNGTDEFGFSALPGGNDTRTGDYGNAGSYGYWWTATQASGTIAHRRSMNNLSSNVLDDNIAKNVYHSVRCVQD